MGSGLSEEIVRTKILFLNHVSNFFLRSPRPYFPFHLIWSENFAAIKIQSYLKGYWVRKQEEVQEIRKFWKVRKYC